MVENIESSILKKYMELLKEKEISKEVIEKVEQSSSASIDYKKILSSISEYIEGEKNEN